MGIFADPSIGQGDSVNQDSCQRPSKYGEFRGRHHRSIGFVLASVAGGALLLNSLPFASGSVPARKSQSPLEKGIAYYQGKTVQFILDSTAGSGFDVQYRVVIAAMGTYLKANFEMVDNPSGAGIAAQNEIAAAQKNGLTFGLLNVSGIFYNDIAGLPSVNFNPEKEDWMGKHDNGATVLYTQSNSPYQSIPQLQATTTANPVKLIEISGLAAVLSNLTMKAFGIHASYLTGYTSSTGEVTGFLRGDGQLYAGSITSLLSELVAHTATALAVFNFGTTLKPYVTPGFTTLANAPTIQQLLQKYPPKTPLEKKSAKLLMDVVNFPQNVIALPARTPIYMLDAMDAAFKYAMTTPSVRSTFQAAGDVPKIQSGAFVLALYKSGLTNLKSIQSVLGYAP